MSTSQSLEDRARTYVLKWCNAIIRGDKATAALRDILRAVDAAATARATEAARAETAQAWRKFDEERERLTAAAAACEKLTAEAEAARGEVERLRADIASQAAGLSNYMDKVTQQAVDIQRLRERLAGAERLIDDHTFNVMVSGTDAVAWVAALSDYRQKYMREATPAAPVTPADRVFNCPECGPGVYVDEDGCCTTCGRDAPVTPVEPPGVLTVSCPHSPEACDGCLSATVEGRPLPAVTPKREPRACTEPAHRHFDLEDACACPDVASEPQSEAPTARVKCDHGDACPGHAPGDRPCNWEPSPEAAPPAPGPERCRQCDGVLILSCPEGCEPPEVCESGCAESVTHHDVEGVPLCTACFESLPDEQAPEDAPPAPCDECDQNDPLNDHGSHGSPEDDQPAPCPCNPEKPVWEQAHHFYCVRLNRAAPPAPAADVPRGPGFGTRRLSEPCSWCEAMPGDPCVPGNDFMPFHLHVNPPSPGSGRLRSASAAPTSTLPPCRAGEVPELNTSECIDHAQCSQPREPNGERVCLAGHCDDFGPMIPMPKPMASAAPTEELPRADVPRGPKATCARCKTQPVRGANVWCDDCIVTAPASEQAKFIADEDAARLRSASAVPTEEPPRNLRGPCACCGLTLPLHTSLAGDVCRNCALGQCTHKPTPPGGSSPGSEAPRRLLSRDVASFVHEMFTARIYPEDAANGCTVEGRVVEAMERMEEEHAKRLADRDAAVSRARAEQLAMALRRVDQSKPLRPLEHDTEYGKGWRHCYEQIRAQVASLSSTTETQTGGGR